MRVSDFHFDLPEELIAQHPPEERGASRMLVVGRQGTEDRKQGAVDGELIDAQFRELPEYLRAGDLLVLNDSRVLPARLYATRAGLATQANSPQPSGQVEVLLVEEAEGWEQEKGNREQQEGLVWRALVKPAKKVRVRETLEFRRTGLGQPVLTAEVIAAGEFGERTLRFAPVEDFFERVARIGHMPLPPYIRRSRDAAQRRTEGLRKTTTEILRAVQNDDLISVEAEDRERYQTVYAQQVGSAAAPTAGLHFTPEILDALRGRGVEIATITLHVGLGTFQPVRVAELNDIRLHAERYTLPAATAAALNRAMRDGRRVIAVGTTTTRTLEHIAAEGRVEAHSGSTSIFIGPGHRFRIVNGLLTNFHLPESTLLMLVSAFAGDGDAGRHRVLAAYAHAIREGYRFYSYGDCMLVTS
jgi:S-adenosylmethionine:tRNA ribosyltransferase-isomerase